MDIGSRLAKFQTPEEGNMYNGWTWRHSHCTRVHQLLRLPFSKSHQWRCWWCKAEIKFGKENRNFQLAVIQVLFFCTHIWLVSQYLLVVINICVVRDSISGSISPSASIYGARWILHGGARCTVRFKHCFPALDDDVSCCYCWDLHYGVGRMYYNDLG